MAEALPLGSEFEVGGKTMLPHTYAVHAAMLQQPAPHPAEPTILIDLDGITDTGPATVRLLIPEALAVAIRDAVNVSLGQLERLRNPER